MKVFVPTRYGVFKFDLMSFISMRSEGWKLSPSAQSCGYLTPRVHRQNKKTKKTEYAVATRVILKPKKNELVDHINQDTRDNTLENLRICNRTRNAQNCTSKAGTSKYKGVCEKKRAKGRSVWRAYITVNKKRIELGFYEDEKEAAHVYNLAATKHFAEYASLNDVTLVGTLKGDERYLRKNMSSKYKGVSLKKKQKPHHKTKWRCHITVNGKRENLGEFDTEESAAREYNNNSIKHFGTSAFLNII